MCMPIVRPELRFKTLLKIASMVNTTHTVVNLFFIIGFIIILIFKIFFMIIF